MIAFLKYNWVATGSHLSSFKTGIMWSYLRVRVAIRAAKFWHTLHTYITFLCIRPYVWKIKHFLKTKAFKIVSTDRLSKTCFVRLIRLRQDIQEETVLVMCSSYVRLVSKITPRSLEVCSGTLSSHHESGVGSGQFGMRVSATKHHKFSFAWVQQ